MRLSDPDLAKVGNSNRPLTRRFPRVSESNSSLAAKYLWKRKMFYTDR
jgi:hypothetical protein